MHKILPSRNRLLYLRDISAKVNKISKHICGREENTVPRIGVLCCRDEERKAIINIIETLAAREGFECSVCSIGQEETDWWKNITCVVMAWEERESAFRYAEKLWDREQSILVIYVAYKMEDIIAALGMPFFHIIRLFSLEQDLEAAFQKMKRMRLSAADRIRFSQNGQLMLVPAKEILYLESEGHEIRLHLQKGKHVEKGIVVVKEKLSQCEERLKGRGFARIYTSYLVNMYHIRCLEKENVLLDNGEHLYVSRRKYPEVKLMFENYIRHLDFMR